MPRNFPAIAAFFAMLLMMTACVSYEEVEIVSIDDVEIVSFSTEKIVVKITATVHNPNNYKIKIVNSDLDLFLNARNMGKATIDDKIVLPKKSKDQHIFTVTSDLKKAGGLIGGILTMGLGGGAELRVKGTIKAKAFGIGKKFPVDLKERVSMSGW